MAQLSDHSHETGYILSLSITWKGNDEPSKCTATVIKAFTPFTKSQVLLVHVHGAPQETPPSMILKIYDPRFFDDERKKPFESSCIPDRPWSLENESAAAERRAAVTRGEREDDYHEDDYYEFDKVLWEEYFYRAMHTSFQSEVEAYTRLEKLQGEGIARCYGFGVLHLSIKRPVSPHVLLLEYISGESLASVDSTRVSRLLARSLITTAHAFGVHGVIHGDIRPDHIVFSPEGPTPLTRAVILDFGHSSLRREMPTPEWEECVHVNGDNWVVRRYLSDRDIRDVDPERALIFPTAKGAVHWNNWAKSLGRRWCEPTDEQWVGPEGVKLTQPVRWKLKDEVTAWLDAKDAGLVVGPDPPRPGSPDFVPIA
ncbi:hypothetical protein JB92DRAFT_3148402 [Gautieria morchelliformis]|nr:hypothetical protein JB92DRAFT_3148402 [Gautieria morchelliformis]